MIGLLAIIYGYVEKVEAWFSIHLLYPALQVMFCWLPYVCISATIWTQNILFYAFMWVIWWTMYLASVWKYLSITGRSLTEMLANPYGAPPCERDKYKKWLKNHGMLEDMEIDKREREQDIRSSFLEFHSKWSKIILNYQAAVGYARKSMFSWMRIFGDQEELRSAVFWLYATAIFMGNVVYYLGRLVCYKVGYISHPIHQHASFNHKRKKRRRFYKTKGIKRWKYKKRWARRSEPSHFVPPRFGQEYQSTVLTTVLNIDSRTNERNTVSFDSDATTVVCDNSANVHICNDRKCFIGDLTPVHGHKVATIGGRGHAPSGIGTVKWSWKDDAGGTHEFQIHNVLYFPQSPINILSVTEFAKQLGDEEGTGIDTKQLRSRFYWDTNKFSLTIHHPDSNLPEMPINAGFKLASLYATMVNAVINTATSFRYSCCFTRLKDCKGCPESCTACATDIVSEEFDIGETLFYTKEGWSGLVKVKTLFMDKDNVLRFVVADSNGKEITTTRENLRAPTNPDIGWIPTTLPEYKSSTRCLTDEQIKTLCSPNHLSPLQQEFLSLHHKLCHLPFQ